MINEQELQQINERQQLQRQKLIEDYEERAAIMQFDGQVDPRHVNRLAYFDWRKSNPGVVVPDAIREKVRLSEK